jgi:hypothetical protein
MISNPYGVFIVTTFSTACQPTLFETSAAAFWGLPASRRMFVTGPRVLADLANNADATARVC